MPRTKLRILSQIWGFWAIENSRLQDYGELHGQTPGSEVSINLNEGRLFDLLDYQNFIVLSEVNQANILAAIDYFDQQGKLVSYEVDPTS